jgi:hypothetical protein
MLAAAYREFVGAAPPGARTGLTSFLQTVEAYRIYEMAARAFETLPVSHAENTAILGEARAFRDRWADTLRDNPLGLVPGRLALDRCRNDDRSAGPMGPLGVPACQPG